MPRLLSLLEDRSKSRLALAAFLSALAILSLLAVGPQLRATDALMPHGVCYQWNPNLMRLHLISDSLIGLAYVAIPITLVQFIRRREDLPFNWMFLLFGVFIVACGATHWMEVWTLWNPDYWVSGAVKAVTAAASVPTAILLYLLVPRALAIPSTVQLTRAKEALEREVHERKRVEAELHAVQHQLEERVAQRTEELRRANERLERQQAELREIDRQKDEFLAILSHEIRNPLHAVLTNAKVLRMATGEAPRERSVAAIERQVMRLGVLLEGLLDVVRATREMSMVLERVDLNMVVQASVEGTRGLAASRGQEIELALAAGPLEVMADAGRVEQALVNLLDNATKFGRAGEPIQVTVGADERFAEVRVRDRGQGLDPEEMRRIFGLFAQGEAGRNAPGMGLGIGLHIVRQVALAHGGDVDAASAGRGRGAEFVFRLPRAPRA